jgi:hypothetical protein
MKVGASLLVALSALAAPSASAQDVPNLSGRYICVQSCQTGIPGSLAYVTQNGWEMNLVNEAGVPSRAWLHWPGRIWADNYNQGAVASPDGMLIQFDGGTVWQRDIGPLPAVVVHRVLRPRYVQ